MVLIRSLGWLVLGAAVAGCSQSLFDNQNGGGGNNGNGMVPSTCADPCVADAARDFDGSATGANQRWRYLEDHRDRTWMAMTAGAQMTGADPHNQITSCKTSSGAAACGMLPGALLISSAGATATADPAIELTAPSTQVIQLSLRVMVPGDADQAVVIYRGSREDVLYRGVATVGKLLETTITIDALAGDRFLLALAPTAKGAGDVAVQLFASATGEVFPKSCQLAFTFEGASGNSITDRCKSARFDSFLDPDSGPPVAAPVVVMPGAFTEEHDAASIAANHYLQAAAPLDQTHDLTVQLWARLRAPVPLYNAWLFSDNDYDVGGGLAIGLILPEAPDPPKLIATTSTDAHASDFIDAIGGYPTDGGWHFIRVVHSAGMTNLCLDGKKLASAQVPDAKLMSASVPYLGKNGKWLPVGAFFDGLIDDVRVFTGALPCE